MTTRKQYSKEFKLDAISLVVEQGYSRAEAAHGLEINANSINTSYLRPTSGDKAMFSRANIVRSGKQIQTINAVAWQNSLEEPTAIASLTFVNAR